MQNLKAVEMGVVAAIVFCWSVRPNPAILIARKKPEIHFPTPTPEARPSGPKPIKRTQKYVALGVYGLSPKISKFPYCTPKKL
jgi:hypothetical protein